MSRPRLCARHGGDVAVTLALRDDSAGTLTRRWLRCQDVTAFRPGGHTRASRAYLDNLGRQLERAHQEHDRLVGRARRLLAVALDELEAFSQAEEAEHGR